MISFKLFLENFDFGDPKEELAKIKDRIKARGSITSRETIRTEKALTLYHGFNTDPTTFGYIFNPKKSEQNLLWFTHSMIRGYDPYEYASNRGDYLLTYPLKANIYKEIVTYENGEKEEKRPEEFSNLAIPTENCQYLAYFNSVIELPEGWFFTYKTEKFIGTNKSFKVNPSMVQELERV